MSNAAVKTRYRAEKYGYSTGMWATSNFETIDKAMAYISSAASGRVYDEFAKAIITEKNWTKKTVPPMFFELYKTHLYDSAANEEDTKTS